jgi:hypothetical protein
MATIEVDDTTVNEVTGIPPNVIADVLVKFVPVMLMIAPAAAVVGANVVIVGAPIKINPACDAVPPGVVRPTEPLAPAPTLARIDVEEITVKDVTDVPPNVMADVLVKLVPVMLMIAPAAAVVGANAVIVGAPIKINPACEALPPGVVRLTAPLLPAPTVATIDVEETTVNDETGVPPNVIADVLLKLVPVILIIAPAAAVVGANVVIVGAAMNVKPASEALPPVVVKLTAPVAPVPTIATIDEDETTVNDETGVPPNVITEVPVKFVPVMLMTAPAASVTGAKLVIVGAGGKYV